MSNVIEAKVMQEMFISAANNLNNNKEYINELNVFPVPDGDTGTNMTLTIMAAASEVEAITEPTVDLLAKAVSGGSLRGARGNSGVILSQLFRGFCREVKGRDVLTIDDLAAGFSHAVETAYKAVMKPKEGTILTVAREMAEKAGEIMDSEDDITLFLEQVVEYGKEVLAKTPEMLAVLKEAGVVDSGGQGLITAMEGMLLALKGEPVKLLEGNAEVELPRGAGILSDKPKSIRYSGGSGKEDISTADIKFGYCTEFIVLLDRELTDKEVDDIKSYLLSIGDSIVCVADEELVKIHVHTNHPGRAFEKGLEYGQLTRCKVDNMREEHSERVLIENEKKKLEEQEIAFNQMKAERKTVKEKYGVIAVASGDGLADIFKEIGADYIIQGGQTMNPSTDDIIRAVNSVNAENIFLLPNNKNIILSCNQASELITDKKIYVVPTKTIPQGISALIAFNKETEPQDNFGTMNECIEDVRSGEVTFAVRDTSVNGKSIHKNNIMGISDNGIDAVGTEVNEVTVSLVESLADEDSELISIYYGEDVTEEEAGALVDTISEKYPDYEIDLKYGGQPIYYYILSVE
ncbi:MAG: DAK2 domain-containing protein [Eubacterium sp.]|nr:DAK2 domain-containing protein [Eubacterium sp.]